jgi:beta-mannosidase
VSAVADTEKYFYFSSATADDWRDAPSCRELIRRPLIMKKLPLPQNWTVRAVSNFDEVPAEIRSREIPAQVPGCVHLDLLRENLIADPYIDQNENLVQWIGRTDWEYSARFEVPQEYFEDERIDLVCEGLDTIATVHINGSEIGRSENMHVEQRFSAKEVLRAGENEITIRFDSAVHYARAMRDRLGDLPNTYPQHEPYNFIRKNACNFGWDWGPTLITCGIWKPIRLEAWSIARIKSVRPLAKVANEKVAVVDVEVELEKASSPEDTEYYVEALLGSRSSSFPYRAVSEFWCDLSNFTKMSVFVKEPQLWWPTGYGEQPLYNLMVRLTSVGNSGEDEHKQRDVFECKLGLREVKLDTTPDETGQSWTLKVNGKKIWCKGANWIPDDVFLPRANEPQRLRTRIQQALDANMNMLRIWGGGIYETDEFYEICDELGVLVWQDFLFACAAYPEEEPMRSLVEEEARFNVARLAKHPSLVLWTGCNENLWGYFDWGWQPKVAGRTWGPGYYFDLLPKVLSELDPTRPYWPGSPFSGTMDIHPLADEFGNKHIWDCWGSTDYTMFRTYSPRFASEFGHQAPPSFSTIEKSIPADGRDPNSASMLHHQKAPGGNKLLHDRLSEHFALPENFDDWLFVTQLNQARAMQTAIEWFRTRSTCAGTLYWQLNDCWPVTSWAAIDGYGVEKPLYWMTKRFFAPRLLTIQPDGDALAVWAHNDTDEVWQREVRVQLRAFEGDLASGVLREEFFSLHAKPRELVKVARLEGWKPDDVTRNHLFATTSGDFPSRAFWFFARDKELQYPQPSFETKLDGNKLIVKTSTLVRDLCCFADRVGAKADSGCVTLLPGERWVFQLSGEVALDEKVLSTAPVLQCANRFGRFTS